MVSLCVCKYKTHNRPKQELHVQFTANGDNTKLSGCLIHCKKKKIPVQISEKS